MRVLVLLPTTGSLNRVLRLNARPDLVTSVVVAAPSFLPMAITKEYDALTSRTGPLAGLGPPVKPGAHWLRLSREIDSGHSWHVPVLLAHVVVALGAELVGEPSKADLVLWSTGEVDAELGIVDQNYKLPSKVACSRTGLQEAAAAGVRIIGFVPPGEDDSLLRALLAEVGAEHALVKRVATVAAARRTVEQALERAQRPDTGASLFGHIRSIVERLLWRLAPAGTQLMAPGRRGDEEMRSWSAHRAPPPQPAARDFGEAEFVSALAGLRDDLREFAADLSGEDHIDKRIPSFIGRLADRIPQAPPSPYELIRLGLNQEVLLGYATTADSEWPEFLSARYHALMRQYERTMSQSPLWRRFKRMTEQKAFRDVQFAAAVRQGTAATDPLQEAEAQDFAHRRT
jgi:hypothetical protein